MGHADWSATVPVASVALTKLHASEDACAPVHPSAHADGTDSLLSGEIERKLSTARVTASTATSTSSAVLSLPKLNRIAPRASSSSRPNALMTGDGSNVPDEQAEPVETATPCMSRW